VLETSLVGFVLVLLAIFGGRWVAESAALAHYFTYSAATLAL
jgi:carbon starvation protein